MGWKTDYERWQSFKSLDQDLFDQLNKYQNDEAWLEDAFYQPLTFGTGGMRGKLGPGINRMNIYTVRKAAKGLALYIESKGDTWKEKGVAVAYDSRYMSPDFALETAKVLGVHGIPTYVFSSLRPTPVLSFAVRHLGASAGVMITASHNPPEYNGYKVYNEVGGQLPPEQADQVIQHVQSVDNELMIDVLSQRELEKKALLRWVDKDVDQAYLEQLKSITINPDMIKENSDDLSVVFTPLHGTAHDMVLAGLDQLGFKQIHTVEEQAKPDPEFRTVASPNPEEHQAFEMAIEKGKDLGADILIGTDPDADRLGVAAKNDQGEYEVLTGNQLGSLMLDYIFSQRQELPSDGSVIKTIVTSELGAKIAESYGVSTLNTLTGFKFIGEKIEEFHQNGHGQFLFGYEESYGYLISDFVRDKDAVQSTMMACEVALYWKRKGKTLFDALNVLFEKHGYYLEDLHSVKLEGVEGSNQIKRMMEEFRTNPIMSVGDFSVVAVEDYSVGQRTYLASGRTEEIDLPKADVVKFLLEDDGWFCLRPSGTEPKIKYYFGVKGQDRKEAENRLELFKNVVLSR